MNVDETWESTASANLALLPVLLMGANPTGAMQLQLCASLTGLSVLGCHQKYQERSLTIFQ